VRPVRLRIGDDAAPFREGAARVGGLELLADVSEEGSGIRVELTVRHPAGRGAKDHAVAVDSVALELEGAPELVLEHGWQSWSVVRRCRPDDVRPERLDAPGLGRATHFAHPQGAGRVVAGDQFLLTTDGVAGFLDGRRHLSTVEAHPAQGVLRAVALLDGVEVGVGEERRLDPLWLADGDPGPLYSEYAARWGAEAGARAGTLGPSGWCSWYQYFWLVRPEDVRANLALAAGHGLEVVQVDDGYQAAIGDWLATNERWAEGTAPMAAEIARAGARPGIWTAPFLAGKTSALAALHPDWMVRHATGSPLRAMYNPVAWGGWAWALDTTRPEVLDHLRETYAALVAQGWTYHKIDFCYAAALPGGRATGASVTRAQALRAGLDAVRQGIGDDAFLVGCGCPLAQAVGCVDAMRVSPDVAPHWEPRSSWPGLEETAVAARNAVSASLLRAPLHRRLWVNDPDCVLLRSSATELTGEQRRRLAAVVDGTGGFTVVSDDLSLYGAEEWAALDQLLSRRQAADTPLTLTDPFGPGAAVGSPCHSLDVAWDEGPVHADPAVPPR